MSIDRKEVEKVARLARLAPDPDELAALTQDLGSILEHVEELRSASVEGVRAMGGVSSHPAPMRADVEGADALERSPGELAPLWKEGFFVVPRLAALDEDAVGDVDG